MRRKVKQESGFYEAYVGFARNLRTWFIAYGIGAPVLFLSNETAWGKIAVSGQGRLIAFLFLAGVAVQILGAIVYKTAMWYLYVSELDRHQAKSWRDRLSDGISGSYWLELIFDFATLALFGVATFLTLQLIG